jgi:uncharacterized protein
MIQSASMEGPTDPELPAKQQGYSSLRKPIAMNTLFEWSEAKARSNLTKHKISFEISARVFTDSFAVTRQDRIENGELRWQTLGKVEEHVILLVAHTLDENIDGTEVIRIISARRANPKERSLYEQQNR